jgi:hypothetical protein
MNEDEKHLSLLSIFHYVVGLLGILFGFFPVIHLIMGILLVTGKFDKGGNNAPPRFIGVFFIVFPLLFMFGAWTFSACLIVAGNYLTRRKRYYFCLVMAGVSCTFMPFGTILGVFTLIVLIRPSVKQLFNVPCQGTVCPEVSEGTR